MFELGRLPVFVDAKDADIEIITRILEIVGIAAVKSDLLLRREDDANVVVSFVLIEMVKAALIKCDHVRAEAAPLFTFLFDLRNRVAARTVCLIGRQAGFDGGVYPRGYIFDRHEHVQLEIGALNFFGPRSRVKTLAQIIVFLAGGFLQGVSADMMIGDGKPNSGNK